MLRLIIEFCNWGLGRLKAGQKVSIPEGDSPVCINLGCGLTVCKGWFNIDGSLNALVASLPKTLHPVMYKLTGAKRHFSKLEYCRLLGDHYFIHHDLSRGIPLKNDIADYVFSSHFLEHLYREDALRLLKECYRVLKKGGLIRISVPDLEFAVSLYSSGQKKRMLEKYFFVEDNRSHYARHKYMYDFELLSIILVDIGFQNIQKQGFQSGEMPDLAALDNRPEDSLFIEARK